MVSSFLQIIQRISADNSKEKEVACNQGIFPDFIQRVFSKILKFELFAFLCSFPPSSSSPKGFGRNHLLTKLWLFIKTNPILMTSYCPVYKAVSHGPGGHSPEKGYGMYGLQDPLFAPLLLFTRPPVEAQVCSQDPYLKDKCKFLPQKLTISENMGIFSCRSSSLAPIFIKKAQKFESYCFSSLFLMKVRSPAPTFTAIYPHISLLSFKAVYW